MWYKFRGANNIPFLPCWMHCALLSPSPPLGRSESCSSRISIGVSSFVKKEGCDGDDGDDLDCVFDTGDDDIDNDDCFDMDFASITVDGSGGDDDGGDDNNDG